MWARWKRAPPVNPGLTSAGWIQAGSQRSSVWTRGCTAGGPRIRCSSGGSAAGVPPDLGSAPGSLATPIQTTQDSRETTKSEITIAMMSQMVRLMKNWHKNHTDDLFWLMYIYRVVSWQEQTYLKPCLSFVLPNKNIDWILTRWGIESPNLVWNWLTKHLISQ